VEDEDDDKDEEAAEGVVVADDISLSFCFRCVYI